MFRTGLLLVGIALAAIFSVGTASEQTSRVVLNGPLNDAVYETNTVTLSCQTSPGDRTQWHEYSSATGGQAALISDNGTVVSPDPNFTMSNDFENGWYNLSIGETSTSYGGMYSCSDENTRDSRSAEVVVLSRNIACNTTIPANNIVLLGNYYSILCMVFYGGSEYITPSTSWSGPGDFNPGQSNGTQADGTSFIAAGLTFIAQKPMAGGRFSMAGFFEQRFFGNQPGSANNVPTLTFSYNSPFIFVQYAPWNISYAPVNPTYEIGQSVTCYADANPVATYRWINMQTAAIVTNQALVFNSVHVGTYTYRCEVVNTWGTQNYFVNITVNPVTTPTVTTTPAPTTPIPAVANCNDLSGKWITRRDDGSQAALCLYVNTSANGAIQGFLENNTNDGYLIDLIGSTRNNIFDETGIVGVWPDDTGVSAMAVECHNCYGEESMIVTLVSRTELDDVTCGDGGALRQSEQYTFSRTDWDTTYCFKP